MSFIFSIFINYFRREEAQAQQEDPSHKEVKEGAQQAQQKENEEEEKEKAEIILNLYY